MRGCMPNWRRCPNRHPADCRRRRRRAVRLTPSGSPRPHDLRRRLRTRDGQRGHRGHGSRLSPVHRPPRRATRCGSLDLVGPCRVRSTASDDPGTTFADRAAAERGYLGWLGQTLVGARASRAAGHSGLQVGIPGHDRLHVRWCDRHRLGPRDDPGSNQPSLTRVSRRTSRHGGPTRPTVVTS